MPVSNTYPIAGSPEPGLVPFYLRFATTTSGAVGATAYGRGYGTPVRNSAGNYTIALADKWPAGSVRAVRAFPTGGGAFDATTPNRDAAIVAIDESGAGTITIQFQRDDTGVAADVRNGASVVVEVWAKNTTA
jgi:hypothetical protein